MFSELVDTVVSRSGRKDRKVDIISYANATVREAHTGQLFERDLVEDSLTPDAVPFVWDVPRLFRVMRTVKYVATGFDDIYPDFILPGKKQQADGGLSSYFYYRASDYFVFSGMSTAPQLSMSVDIAYYSFLPRLTYYEVNARPAVYDVETDTWTYLLNGAYVSTLGTDELDAAARAKVTNWLIFNHQHLVEEGTLAKILKQVGDPRSVTSYSLFKQYVTGMEGSENYASLDR